MRTALCFIPDENVNDKYHAPLWREALSCIGWPETTLENAELAVFWGVKPGIETAKRYGIPVLQIDFPYWNRAWKNRDGNEYYKISINGQHPTPYIMRETHTSARRFQTKAPEIKPWRKGGDYIVLAGTGMKAACQYGWDFQQWERRTIAAIRQVSKMPIIYRPKPNNTICAPIDGVEFDDGSRPLEQLLENAYALATHHGNTAVDALACGVPVFMQGNIGVASHLARTDFSQINHPIYPEREQFFNNLAWWQWSVEEIRRGVPLLSYLHRGFYENRHHLPA